MEAAQAERLRASEPMQEHKTHYATLAAYAASVAYRIVRGRRRGGGAMGARVPESLARDRGVAGAPLHRCLRVQR